MNSRILDLKTGYGCNNNCVFCVAHDNKHLGDRTTAELKADMKESIGRCDRIVFTGGEVTIRDDLLELLSYAKELGFKSIELQSNCRMLANKTFLKKVIDAGVTAFGPSIHGHTAALHDSLTRVPGSFHQTVKAIMNMKELGAEVGTNTVITKQNYKSLPVIASLLKKLDVNQPQFAFVHPMGAAMDNFDSVVPRMMDVIPFLHTAIQICLDAHINVKTEGVPYCMMYGYEDLISESILIDIETKSMLYDDEDWLNTRKSKAKDKPDSCRKCKFDQLCEGTWKEYVSFNSGNEFVPRQPFAIKNDVAKYIRTALSRGMGIPLIDVDSARLSLKWISGLSMKTLISLRRYGKRDAYKLIAKKLSAIHEKSVMEINKSYVHKYIRKRIKDLLAMAKSMDVSDKTLSLAKDYMNKRLPKDLTPDLIHGDFSPRNLILNNQGIFLIDFETVRKASLEEDILSLFFRDKSGVFASTYASQNPRARQVIENMKRDFDFYKIYDCFIEGNFIRLEEYLLYGRKD